MDKQTIIKNSVGKEVINKLTNAIACINGVSDGEKFVVYVNNGMDLEQLNFEQFELKYHLEFSL